ncbi:MAG: hypothetical protein D8M53_03065 [Armatimonadetes bacterium]|nr:hypothetical protein [Armatimonadota bacterium]
MTGEAMNMNQTARDRQRKMTQEVDRMNRDGKARQEALMAQAMGRPMPTAPAWPDTKSHGSPGVPPLPNTGPPLPGGIQRRRPYMAGLGRFLTEARLAERLGGEHPYGYAMNNPTTYTDPSGLTPTTCSPANDCDKYPHVPGWYDGHTGLEQALIAAAKECPEYSPNVSSDLLWCIAARETAGRESPWNTGGKTIGPCQIWPGSDKDKLCGGLNWKGDLVDHMRCCARILCACIKAGGGNVVTGCGTTGAGKNRKGQFQVINQSGAGYEPFFKCCLKRRGWKNPTQEVPIAKR